MLSTDNILFLLYYVNTFDPLYIQFTCLNVVNTDFVDLFDLIKRVNLFEITFLLIKHKTMIVGYIAYCIPMKCKCCFLIIYTPNQYKIIPKPNI